MSTAKQLLGLFFDTRGRCRQLAKKGEILPIGSISFCVSETENNKRSAVVEVEVIADNGASMLPLRVFWAKLVKKHYPLDYCE